MKIKWILSIFFFVLIFILGKIFIGYIPNGWKYCFAFILGEITFAIFSYFINKE